jgi:hypothetical protein
MLGADRDAHQRVVDSGGGHSIDMETRASAAVFTSRSVHSREIKELLNEVLQYSWVGIREPDLRSLSENVVRSSA